MRRFLAPLTALLLLAVAPAAQAAWFAAEPVDGPAEIDALGDVDVARDGSGDPKLEDIHDDGKYPHDTRLIQLNNQRNEIKRIKGDKLTTQLAGRPHHRSLSNLAAILPHHI